MRAKIALYKLTYFFVINSKYLINFKHKKVEVKIAHI